LLAYKSPAQQAESGDTPESRVVLAKAEDIFVVDNMNYGRMFPVLRAPHETDLEDFYILLGSRFISKEVEKRFEIVGRATSGTSRTVALMERIKERAPLLVSPYVTSRPLVPRAAAVLDPGHLEVFEADDLIAVYKLLKMERRQRVTCCAKPLGGRKKNALYVLNPFDFFDAGQSIGELILERCQLEDSFFIASLLEAPLDQLRARGFPVDRVLKPPEPIPEVLPSSKKAEAKEKVTQSNANQMAPAVKHQSVPDPTVDKATATGLEDDSPLASTRRVSENAVGSGGQSANSPSPNEKADDIDPVLSRDEIIEMCKQMFPDVDDAFLRTRLGPNPSLDDVRKLANEMASGNYEKIHASSDSVPSVAKPSKKGRTGIRKKLGRALGNFRGSSAAGDTNIEAPQNMPVQSSASSGTQSEPSSERRPGADSGPVAPESDASSHRNMCDMLRQTLAKKTAPVNSKGIETSDTLLTNIPKELDRGTTCEVVPSQSLKPFPGHRGDGRTHNGIPVFSTRKSLDSEAFLSSHQDTVESFSLVLKRLGEVYELNSNSIALFHDPTGGTIAFNAGGSLHFNVRFFYSLHYMQGKKESFDCYSFWYVTYGHELAHNLVTGHGREHGFYTESYVSLYLPRFLSLMGTLPLGSS
jgi:hypothetical protein